MPAADGLQIFWFGVIALLWIYYFFLEGFDRTERFLERPRCGQPLGESAQVYGREGGIPFALQQRGGGSQQRAPLL